MFNGDIGGKGGKGMEVDGEGRRVGGGRGAEEELDAVEERVGGGDGAKARGVPEQAAKQAEVCG